MIYENEKNKFFSHGTLDPNRPLPEDEFKQDPLLQKAETKTEEIFIPFSSNEDDPEKEW